MGVSSEAEGTFRSLKQTSAAVSSLLFLKTDRSEFQNGGTKMGREVTPKGRATSKHGMNPAVTILYVARNSGTFKIKPRGDSRLRRLLQNSAEIGLAPDLANTLAPDLATLSEVIPDSQHSKPNDRHENPVA